MTQQAQQDAVRMRIVELLNESVHSIGKEDVIKQAILALDEFVDENNHQECYTLERVIYEVFGYE